MLVQNQFRRSSCNALPSTAFEFWLTGKSTTDGVGFLGSDSKKDNVIRIICSKENVSKTACTLEHTDE